MRRYTLEHTDPDADYNKIGIKHASAGDLSKAREYFRAASLHAPQRGDVWANIGLTIHDQCKDALAQNPASKKAKKCLNAMREGLACLQVGMLLGNAKAHGMWASALGTFKHYFPSECESSDDDRKCTRFNKEAKAMEMVTKKSQLLDGVNHLCGKPEDLAVSFNSWELKKGIVYGETFRRVLILLRVCGVVHLQSTFDFDKVLAPIAAAHAAEFKAWTERAVAKDPQFKSSNIEWANAASRGFSRFETKFPMKAPFIDPRFAGNRLLSKVVKGILGARVELDTFSAVTSMPGSSDQMWHSDVADLFAQNEGEDKHIPAHGLVAVVPFVDLTPETGATEYYMGSHVYYGNDFFVDQDDSPPTPQRELFAKAGDVVLFDMRLRHRGRRNKSDNDRAIGYLGYVQDWYSDKVNFKDRQTRAFDNLPLKKLFARQDQKQYLANLERLVEEKYGKSKLDELQTEGNWKAVNMRF